MDSPASPLPPSPPPPAEGMPTSAHRRAATALWISGALLLLASTCCVGSVAALGFLPLDEIRNEDRAGSVPPEMWDQLESARPYLPAAAAFIALFTLVPAAAMLVLGFSVARGRRGAAVAALVSVGVALLPVGLGFLLSLPALAGGAGGLLNVLVMGGLTGLLIWCIRSLKNALRAPAPASDTGRWAPDDDPWEHTL